MTLYFKIAKTFCCRYGRDTEGAIRTLVARCSRPLPEMAGIKATQLFSKNADVDTVNSRELEALSGALVWHMPPNNCLLANPHTCDPSACCAPALMMLPG